MSKCQNTSHVHWEASPGWHRHLCHLPATSLTEWLNQQHAQLIKHGPKRRVYRLSVDGERVVLKWYRDTGGLANLFRQSTARREWSNLIELRDRGIATLEPLALGEVGSGLRVGDTFLLTREIENACNVYEYFEKISLAADASSRTRLRRSLLAGLGRLTAASHTAGVDHDDFHLGNVLVERVICEEAIAHRAEIAQPLRLYLIDVPGVRFRKSISWARGCKSLATFAAELLWRCEPAELQVLVAAYMSGRASQCDERLEDVTDSIVQRGMAWSRNIYRKRDRRAVRNNRDFRVVRLDDATAYSSVRLAEKPGSAAAAVVTDCVTRYLASAATGTLENVFLEDATGSKRAVQVAVTSCRNAGRRRLPHSQRHNPILDQWIKANALEARGIATPAALIASEPRGTAGDGVSRLVVQRSPGAVDLRAYIGRIQQQPARIRQRRSWRVADQLGALIGQMHFWAISHVKLDTSAIQVNVADPAACTCLIGNVAGIRITKKISMREQQHQLRRLLDDVASLISPTSTIYMRFMRSYRHALRHVRVDWKQLWRGLAVTATDHRRIARPYTSNSEKHATIVSPHQSVVAHTAHTELAPRAVGVGQLNSP